MDPQVLRDASLARVESYAETAYKLAHVDVESPPGVGLVLRRLFGPASVRLCDSVPPERCFVEFGRIGSNRLHPLFARLAPQSRPSLTIAAARGCAHYLEWYLGRGSWGEDLFQAVALAIIMPRTAFEFEARTSNPQALAASYVVDLQRVCQRLAALRIDAGGGSGEYASGYQIA